MYHFILYAFHNFIAKLIRCNQVFVNINLVWFVGTQVKHLKDHSEEEKN